MTKVILTHFLLLKKLFCMYTVHYELPMTAIWRRKEKIIEEKNEDKSLKDSGKKCDSTARYALPITAIYKNCKQIKKKEKIKKSEKYRKKW